MDLKCTGLKKRQDKIMINMTKHGKNNNVNENYNYLLEQIFYKKL